MHIIRSSQLKFIPASHEDPKNPGSLKKVIARRADLDQGNIQMINWALLPVGKSFELHFHEDMQEVFIILSGIAEIKIEKETETLNKGDLVIIPAKAVHQMINTGGKDVEYIALGISKAGKGETINV
jgi:mannose-6-phosphate isomerase-like protein (cupin superfamily)